MTDTGTDDIAIVLGTRPEIIKLAPVIRACNARGVRPCLIHTGQHYSEELDDVFFEQLGLPNPDYNLAVGSGSHGEQTGQMLINLEEVLLYEDPDIVLVQGDTNSVLAGAIVTSKLEMELGHIEAGLRSFDRAMPEETNRVVTDHVADYLFPPTEDAASLLRDEGIRDEAICVTGNTVVDAVQKHKQLSEEKSSALSDLNVTSEEFALLTAHRAENVDDERRFRNILAGISQFASTHSVEVIYPIHPRAENRLEEFDMDVQETIRTIPPLDYLDFLKLEANATLAFTDSGGVQEETCILRTPCVTVRDSTERPETLDVGSNTLVGADADAIREGAEMMLTREADWDNPFGDGNAAEYILDHLR